jgi:putative nucleotidyltransferase with HDIG domain
MSKLTAELDAASERRVEESRERRSRGMHRRELLAVIPFTVAFLAAAVALAALADAARELSVPLAVAFVVAYAVADRIEFSVGAGSVVPTQLVFVPMLLLLPTPLVPLLVAIAVLLSHLPEYIRSPKRLTAGLTGTADASFSLGPAIVLVLAGAQLPGWEHLPAYVCAFAAQLLFDQVYSASRMRAFGVPVRETIGEMWVTWRVDSLLFPVGLLAALAAADAPAGALLVLALVPLLVGFGREREASIQRSLELSRAYRGTALLLRDLLEEDDEYTGHHTEDVVELAVKVADEMGLDEDTRRETEMGALLHDIGKIAVPDEIINKPGPLDDDEWAIMKTHTVVGERMLQQVGGLLTSVGRVVRASHERWDGGGYPDGLAGEEIPMAARICAACDAFNAMTTDRSYRKALPLEVAIAELRANSGTQFAPDVVDALIAVVARETPGWELALSAPAAQAAGGRSITVSSAP